MIAIADEESNNVAKISISEALKGFDQSNHQEEINDHGPYYHKWSEVLKSNTKGDAYTPSRELNKETSLHGEGIKAIIERANGLQQVEKRMVKLIRNIADLQEYFGQSLGKSCHSQNAALHDLENDNLTKNCVIRELRKISNENEEVSRYLKDQVAQNIMTNSLSTAQNISQIYNKYTNSRDVAVKARRKALKAKVRYAKSIQEAQSSISDVKKNNAITMDNPAASTPSQSDAPLTPNTRKKTWDSKLFGNNKSTDRLLHILNSVHKNELLYTQLVHEENNAVEQCVSVELETLESLQEIEVQRFQTLHQSFSQLLKIKCNSFNNDNATTGSPRASPTPPPIAPLSPFIFNKKRHPSAIDESSSHDHLSFDLPHDVVELRSKVKSTLTAHSATLQMMKSLSTLSDDLACCAFDFANSMQSRLNQDGYNKVASSFNKQPLSDAIAQVEATKLLMCWDNGIVHTFLTQSTAASELASCIRNMKQVNLDALLVSFESQVKNTQEQEDTRWKLLCEAARNEMKAIARHEQSTAECDKALARLSSANHESNHKNDADSSQHNSPTSSTPEFMNKAIGNMFSIVGSKGEVAMGKMLTAKARQSIAKVTYGDAELKLDKDSKLMESASSAKKEALESYSLAADAFLSSKSSSADFSSELKQMRDTIAKSFETFNRTQRESLDVAMDVLISCKGDALFEDLSGWALSLQQKLEVKNTKLSPTKFSGGFSLSTELEDWEDIQQALIQLTTQAQQEQHLEEDDIRVVEHDETDDSYSFCSTSTCNALEKDASSTRTDATNNLTSTSHDANNNESTVSIGSAPSFADDNASVQSSISNKQMEEEDGNASTTSATDANESGASTVTKSPISTPHKKNSINSLFSKTASSISNEVFLSHFGDGDVNGEGNALPSIIESYSCAYWPPQEEGSLLPLLHGRMFITDAALYFVGWGGKKIILEWKNAVSVTKCANVMGTVDNSLKIYYSNSEERNDDTDELPSYYFGSFMARGSCFQTISEMISKGTTSTSDDPSPDTQNITNQSDSTTIQKDVPPDEILPKMEVVVDKKLRNVSISKFYDLCWSDENNANLYGDWLTDKGSIDVEVTNWEKEKIVNSWCGEEYAQKRVVTFKHRRTTHLYIGPPIATVEQTQYLRMEDEDRCVLAMTVKMDGIPYADVFCVECRWVASRIGNSDVKVQAGIFVDFKKSTFLKSKIRDGTIKETSPAYVDFYGVMQRAVKQHQQDNGAEINDVEEEEEVEVEENKESRGWITTVVDYTSTLKSAVSTGYQKDIVLFGIFVLIYFYLWQKQQQERLKYENDMKYLSTKVEQLEDDIHLIRGLLEKTVNNNNQEK